MINVDYIQQYKNPYKQ